MKIKIILFFVVGFVTIFLGGCFQAHSGDNLRTVPTTNNPYLIQDSQKGALGGTGARF